MCNKSKNKNTPKLSVVVAVDNNWGIGRNGELLARVSCDLKQFRAITTGKTVILGSKTLATFPGGRPLKNRRNIILSRRNGYCVEGAETAHSVDEVLSMLNDGEEAVVIGGASVYEQMLPFCSVAYVTHFDRTFDGADAFFPNLDADTDWIMTSEGETLMTEENDMPNDMSYKFCVYERVTK